MSGQDRASRDASGPGGAFDILKEIRHRRIQHRRDGRKSAKPDPSRSLLIPADQIARNAEAQSQIFPRQAGVLTPPPEPLSDQTVDEFGCLIQIAPLSASAFRASAFRAAAFRAAAFRILAPDPRVQGGGRRSGDAPAPASDPLLNAS